MEIRYSVCPHDCPDTCAWIVHMSDGKIVKVNGDPDHPVTKGVICEKARYYPHRLYGKERVLYPMRRKGKKGEGEFVRITWDEALTSITDYWKTLINKYGSESILPYSYAGTEGVINNSSMDRRFFNKLGATRLERTICSAAGSAGFNLVYGQGKGINPLDSAQAKVILFWGINALETNLHQAILAEQARKNGAKIIAIDVHRNKTAGWADVFYHILPGSDGALALGIAHIIVRDGLADLSWAREHTHGLAQFMVTLQDYPPDKVARLTGLNPGQIEELARLYTQNRPSLIRIGNGFQHHDNGGMATWAISCLPALIGTWEDKGGGAIKFNSGYFPTNRDALERPDLLKGSPRIVNMNQLGRALTELDPAIYALYVYNSNPAIVAPEQRLVKKGLAREDLFTVVHEQVWTDTTRFADIVLPATTHLEHPDLYKSYWHCVLQWADPVIPPLGESKANIEVFAELAARMGYTDSCFQDTTEEIAQQALDLPYWKEQEITVERLRRERYIPIEVPELPFATGTFPTPSGKAELSSEQARSQGMSEVPCHVPLSEGPETANTLYPITLISAPNHYFLNSTFAEIPQIREKAGVPLLEINPVDAASRSIKDGDLVKVYNDRGICQLVTCVKDSVLPGVAVTTGLHWYSEDNCGINELTPSRLADMGHGATFFSNLVEIQKMSTD